jgi:AmmeMemoRadiSam system protein B
MMRIRRPAVAGTFYPADPDELATMVDGFLAAAQPPHAGGPPVAVIAPHAGYVYSGPTAGVAYAQLRLWAPLISRVVVVGPAHWVPTRGLALSTADAFETPLGRITIDRAACAELLAHPAVCLSDEAHRDEHSLEVHLPFLQRVLGGHWTLVPVVAGSGPAPMIADAFDALWGTAGTLFVISTDLSHYHDLATARSLDAATAAAIVAADWEHLRSTDACGAVPVCGALELARRHGEHITLLDLSTSADTIGPADRVVGYGSFEIR